MSILVFLGLLFSEGLLADFVVIKSTQHACIFEYNGSVYIVFNRSFPIVYRIIANGVINVTNCSITLVNVSTFGENPSAYHAVLVSEFIKLLLSNLTSPEHGSARGATGGYRVGSGPSYTCRDYVSHVAGGILRGCMLRVKGCELMVPAQVSGIVRLRGISGALEEVINLYMVSLKPQGCFVPNASFYAFMFVVNSCIAVLAGVITYVLLGRWLGNG